MPNWIPIVYRGFYDQPRTFICKDANQTYLFDCPFDGSLDDYPDHYTVYLMSSLEPIWLVGSWTEFESKAIRILGRVGVTAVAFDPTKRKMVDLEILSEVVHNV